MEQYINNTSKFPKRKRNRLDGYDYSLSGAYFVTICVKDRAPILWESVGADNIRPNHIDPNPVRELSEYGKIVDRAIKNIPDNYPNVFVPEYAIMPDHVHIIVYIYDKSVNSNRQNECDGRIISAPTANLSAVIGQMKRWASKQAGFSLWQKSFYDHIIRDERDYEAVRRYIDENSMKYF